MQLLFPLLNSDLQKISNTTVLWETSGLSGSKDMDLSQYRFILVIITSSPFSTQSILKPMYIQSLTTIGIQTQVGLIDGSGYEYTNISYTGSTLSFASSKNMAIDIIGVE